MSALRQVRGWLSAKRRFQFVLTLVMVSALTAACGALLMLPNSVLPTLRAVVPGQDASQATDPQVPLVKRSMDAYGKVVAEPVPTGSGRTGIVLGHPGQRADLDVLASELAASTAAVSALWGQDWNRAPVVVVASSPSEFAALTRATGDVPAEVAASTIADPYRPGTQLTGQRVVFGPDAGRRLGADGLRSVLRHELTHMASRAVTVDGSPMWMLEGFAEYSAHRGMRHPIAQIAPTLTARARAGDLPADLPADAMFEPSSGKASLAYEQGWSACAFIADRYGDQTLVELYRQLASGPKDRAAVEAVLRDSLGTTSADLVGQWRAWLTSRTTEGA
ncbi:peptidase MA family metallohydrolase [Nocardia sp. CA-145437]|uniref:peptidase MA family metallohydrolase n=1 Tax=Nocardia sp. CA-145437 TaxID=3239980 RepID=UPI003D96B789